MNQDRTRGWPPDPDQDPQPNPPNGPPRNVTRHICVVYDVDHQFLDSTAVQEGQDLGQGRIVTLDIDFQIDGAASLPHSVNNVVLQQGASSRPPEGSPVQATSQVDSLERQANVRAESNSIYSITARPASAQQGIRQPPVLPGATGFTPVLPQRQQRSSNVLIQEVVAVPDQSGRAVSVLPRLQATVVSQGAEGGGAGFQTLQDPSTVVQGVGEVEDQLKEIGYEPQKIQAVRGRFGPKVMVSVDVFLEYEKKYDAESAASNEPSSDLASHTLSERYHTAQPYIPARDQRVPGTKNSLPRYSPGLNADHYQKMEYIILKTSMAETDQRERSFQGWPHRSMKLTPQRLADAGLYFTGDKDACRCFSCGGILHRWEDNDDPWVEHARLHPHCSYVRYVKGGLFIDQLRIKK